MRAPQRKRPLRREIHVPPNTDLGNVADNAKYIGSPEHRRDRRSFAGPSALRLDASQCPPEINDRRMVTGWLRDSIREGTVGGMWEGKFPRYVWHREGDTIYEGRLTNRISGEYKGYPLSPAEWPSGI